jgi:hypothetical protein
MDLSKYGKMKVPRVNGMCVFLMPILRPFKGFGTRFTEDRGEAMTYFIFLHHFCGLHYRVMCICG